MRVKFPPPAGLLRDSAGGTPIELVELLAPLYQFDTDQVLDFVATTVRPGTLGGAKPASRKFMLRQGNQSWCGEFHNWPPPRERD